jgi:hypothetical protein
MVDFCYWKGSRRPHILQAKPDIYDQMLYLKQLSKSHVKAVDGSAEKEIFLEKPNFSDDDPIA